MDHCIFCGDSLSGNRAKEHVIPQWLLDHLDIRDRLITPRHVSPKFDETGKLELVEERSRRHHTLENLIAGHVCAQCNSGWMAQLEGDVQGPLTRLIADECTPYDLTTQERFDLSRWTAKTAYALNRSAAYPNIVPWHHLRHVKESDIELPQNVFVVCGRAKLDLPFTWYQTPSFMAYAKTETDVDEAITYARRCYKIGFQFRKFLILVGFWPGKSRIGLTVGTHYPVWPFFQEYCMLVDERRSEKHTLSSFAYSISVFIGFPNDGRNPCLDEVRNLGVVPLRLEHEDFDPE